MESTPKAAEIGTREVVLNNPQAVLETKEMHGAVKDKEKDMVRAKDKLERTELRKVLKDCPPHPPKGHQNLPTDYRCRPTIGLKEVAPAKRRRRAFLARSNAFSVADR